MSLQAGLRSIGFSIKKNRGVFTEDEDCPHLNVLVRTIKTLFLLCRETPEKCVCKDGLCKEESWECHKDQDCKKMKKCNGKKCVCLRRILFLLSVITNLFRGKNYKTYKRSARILFSTTYYEVTKVLSNFEILDVSSNIFLRSLKNS